MKRLSALAVLLLLAVTAHSETFRFKFDQGDKYHITSEVRENVHVNGQFLNTAEILNRASLEVVEQRGRSWRFKGKFEVSETMEGGQGLFKMNNETYFSEYWRDEFGQMTIGPQYFAPFQRSVPVFPQGEVIQGQSWRSGGEEVHDLRSPFGVNQPVIVPLAVFATFQGIEKREGVEVAVFRITTTVNAKLGTTWSPTGITPVKIKGTSDQLYYFDLRQGRLQATEDTFDYIYLLSNGEYIEYEGVSEGRVTYAQEMNRRKIEDEIRKSIEEQGIPDATVESDDEGVTITLQNIQFPPDSDFLMPAERDKLEKLGEILMRYADRDLLITGHTALAGTADGRQALSEQRASVVGNYLLSRGVRDRTQIFFRGVGASEPVADNSTETGRRFNRRVEIKLLEN